MDGDFELQQLLREYSDDRQYNKAHEDRLFYWQDIKWYDSYSEISKLMAAVQESGYDNFYFMRIGEGLDDIEVDGGFWDNPFEIRCDRSIEYSFSDI